MQKKSLETFLYSTAGVAVMALILIAVNVLMSGVRLRSDRTSDRAYTLSEGTRSILAKLDTPVKIRFYCTQSDAATPETVFLKSYAKKVEDLLAEYRQASRGKIVIEKLNPLPESDAEDSARLDGLEEQELRGADVFYLGLAVSVLDSKETIPFLRPDRERELEYDISRAITRVIHPEKPVVGIMSSLPLFGTESNPMMMQMGQQGQPPWMIVNTLQADFDVRRIAVNANRIDDDIKVLFVVHPTGITDEGQFAIDQFIMRGGKLIAFLDPQSLADSRGQNPMMQMQSQGSSLDKLIRAWGLEFDSGKVVADRTYKWPFEESPAQQRPAWLVLTPDAFHTNDISTSQLDSMWYLGGGAFTGTPVAGLNQEVLLRSSKDSQLIEGFMANFGGEGVMRDFKASGVEYAMAVRLTGRFKTAFPDGKPGSTNAVQVEGAGVETKAESLKESREENAVVLVGDADIIFDPAALEQVRTPFGSYYRPRNGNLFFAQNLVEQLSGDSNLIAVRSRAVQSRPFTRIQKIEAEADKRFMAKIQELQESRDQALARLNELQQQKNQNQRFILSPEQNAEIENLRQKEAQVSTELRKVQKDRRSEIVSLQRTVQAWNIAAMPLVVIGVGISMAVLKRKRTSAK